MTICPGRLGPGSKGPLGRPSVPGDSCPGPRAHMVDQMSRATRAQVRGPAGSTNNPARLGSYSEGSRGGPTVPGDLGPCPTARGVDQLSWVTLDHARGAAGSNSCFGRLALGQATRGRPTLQGDSGSGPRGLGVDQVSLVTLALVQGPEGWTSNPQATRASFRRTLGSTSGPGLFGPVPEGRLCQQVPRATRFGSECPRCRPGDPGDSDPCPRALGVNQPSRETCARVRGPVG